MKLMSVAPQNFVSTRKRRSRKAAVSQLPTTLKARKASLKREPVPPPKVIPVPTRANNLREMSLRDKQAAPPWLRTLVRAQRSSSVITFLLFALTLTVYAWTVYNQQRWAQDYHKLENLQRQERQMTAANEVLKNQLAQQAENPSTGLVAPSPENTIFMSPAPQRPLTTASPQHAVPQPSPKAPLGY